MPSHRADNSACCWDANPMMGSAIVEHGASRIKSQGDEYLQTVRHSMVPLSLVFQLASQSVDECLDSRSGEPIFFKHIRVIVYICQAALFGPEILVLFLALALHGVAEDTPF